MNKTMFESQRINMRDAMDLTIKSLTHYGSTHEHWALCWSGGKDSTALVTMVVWLIDSGRIPKPRSLTVLYADTRLELPPLQAAARDIMADLTDRGYPVRVVTAPLDKRFFVYMFGRGVPTPGAHFRWCTGQLKITPMAAAVEEVYHANGGQKLLLLTGVRQGESAFRDGRIAMSCGRDGAECGQGWYQESLQGSTCDALAPLLHWRVCHVWEWLKHWATRAEYGDWNTALIADAYGGDEAEEINARTGCICCPVASKDKALETILKILAWSHLRPLLELREVFREMRLAKHRLRKPLGERGANGRKVKNQMRKGPLTMEARRYGLSMVLDIQERINSVARERGLFQISLINAEEHARILELIDANTWPDKWTGDEPSGDVVPEFFGQALEAVR